MPVTPIARAGRAAGGGVERPSALDVALFAGADQSEASGCPPFSYALLAALLARADQGAVGDHSSLLARADQAKVCDQIGLEALCLHRLEGRQCPLWIPVLLAGADQGAVGEPLR